MSQQQMQQSFPDHPTLEHFRVCTNMGRIDQSPSLSSPANCSTTNYLSSVCSSSDCCSYCSIHCIFVTNCKKASCPSLQLWKRMWLLFMVLDYCCSNCRSSYWSWFSVLQPATTRRKSEYQSSIHLPTSNCYTLFGIMGGQKRIHKNAKQTKAWMNCMC